MKAIFRVDQVVDETGVVSDRAPAKRISASPDADAGENKGAGSLWRDGQATGSLVLVVNGKDAVDALTPGKDAAGNVDPETAAIRPGTRISVEILA